MSTLGVIIDHVIAHYFINFYIALELILVITLIAEDGMEWFNLGFNIWRFYRDPLMMQPLTHHRALQRH